MIAPAFGVTLLLSLLAERGETAALEEAKRQGWSVDSVPRLWFEEDPSVVPAPFSFHSNQQVPLANHPYRTAHVLIRPKDFFVLSSSSDATLEWKKERMLEKYLEPARRMVQGEEPAAFPIPWVGVRYKDGKPYVSTHEGRHRALLAIELGLEVMPLIVILQSGPEGWEHQRGSIETDPLVQRVTKGLPVLVRTQDHGREHPVRAKPFHLVPRAPNGRPLMIELAILSGNNPSVSPIGFVED